MPRTTKANQTRLHIKTFYPLVGSLRDYQKNLTEILSAIQTRDLTRLEAVEWVMQRHKSSREFCRHLLDMLKSVGLIVTTGNRYTLTDAAQCYLETGHPDVLASVFVNKVLGFAELVNTLGEIGAQDKAVLRTEWEARLPVRLAPNQFDHRLNWLRALGYVDVVARNYLLTDRGLKLAAEIKEKAATTIEEKQQVSHRDLEDRVRLIGEFFEFQTTVRASVNDVLPSYAIKLTEMDRQLDCLWVRYVPFGGKIKFPVEIHLTGNLADTIDRLETVSEYVQKAVIITAEQQERTIVDRLRVKKSRLLDKLVIVSVEDVYKAVQAASVLKSFTTKIFSD